MRIPQGKDILYQFSFSTTEFIYLITYPYSGVKRGPLNFSSKLFFENSFKYCYFQRLGEKITKKVKKVLTKCGGQEIIRSGRKWEKMGAKEANSMDVAQTRLSNSLERHNDISTKQRVLLFCTKHPKMKFVPECIATDHKIDKVTVAKEIQSLVDQGIIEKQVSNVGTVWYCFNGMRQELIELSGS
jgi:predicted transcriptional regulator